MNLLIINDNMFEVQTMQKSVDWTLYGIDKAFIAYNANEAKTIIQSEPIDIALCDIEMPGENGIALIRWIRQNNYEIECILLTCHADFAYAQEAVSLGCIKYILLPSRYEVIGETVKAAADKLLQARSDKELKQYGESYLRIHDSSGNEIPEDVLKPQEVVQQCKQYILDHLDMEELNISEIASHFCLSSIYLNRIFKREAGTSINQWMIQEKMKLAAHLLKTTDYSAALVAQRVGYSNYPYFSTVFKKFYGCAPSQYGR